MRIHTPNVSVVIPVYNRVHLLSVAIESALVQRDVHSEIIVIDDGSKQEVRPAIESFESGRIRVIRTEHRGIAAARNIGIKCARGKYVAFLDSDDRFMSSKLYRQIAAIEANADCGWSLCGCVYQRGTQHMLVRLSGMKPSSLRTRCPVGASALVVRKDLLESLDGFDESFSVSEDWDLMLRLASSSGAAICADAMYYYMLDCGGVSDIMPSEIWRQSWSKLAKKHELGNGVADYCGTYIDRLLCSRALEVARPQVANGEKRGQSYEIGAGHNAECDGRDVHVDGSTEKNLASRDRWSGDAFDVDRTAHVVTANDRGAINSISSVNGLQRIVEDALQGIEYFRVHEADRDVASETIGSLSVDRGLLGIGVYGSAAGAGGCRDVDLCVIGTEMIEQFCTMTMPSGVELEIHCTSMDMIKDQIAAIYWAGDNAYLGYYKYADMRIVYSKQNVGKGAIDRILHGDASLVPFMWSLYVGLSEIYLDKVADVEQLTLGRYLAAVARLSGVEMPPRSVALNNAQGKVWLAERVCYMAKPYQEMKAKGDSVKILRYPPNIRGDKLLRGKHDVLRHGRSALRSRG